MKTPKIKKQTISCEMCRQNSALKQTETGNLLCDPCYLLFIDAHNHAATTRGLGWPLYGSTIHNLFGTFILLCGLFIFPTPAMIPDVQIPAPPIFGSFTPNNPRGFTSLDLDDSSGTMKQTWCVPDGPNNTLCIEYDR